MGEMAKLMPFPGQNINLINFINLINLISGDGPGNSLLFWELI